MRIEFELPDLSELKVPSFLKKIDIYHIILISAALRLFCISFPSDGKIFDEFHYTQAVQDILLGKYGNPEHPPLSKLVVAVFVKVFGNYWFAWRLPSVIFSLASTYLLYHIAREFFDEKMSLFAASFLTFDIVWFINGNIFLLEPLALMFNFWFVLLYLKGRYKWSAVAFSFACLSNEKSLLFLVAVGLYHLMTNFDPQIRKKLTDRSTLRGLFTFLLIFMVVGGGGLWAVDTVLKPVKSINYNVNTHITKFEDEAGNPTRTETVVRTFTEYDYATNPIEHVIFMWDFYGRVRDVVNVTQEGYRPPWSWITPFGADPFDRKSYYANIVSLEDKRHYSINYVPQTMIPIWYMTIPIVALAIYNYKEKEAKLILSWVAVTFTPWVVITLIFSKCSYNKNFILTLPIICFGIPWFWSRVGGRYKYPLMIAHLAITVLFFFNFFPVSMFKPWWVTP